MRNEEKFIRDVLINTQKGKIEWQKYDLPSEVKEHFAAMYYISKGINPEFKISIVKMKCEENPFAFFVILNDKRVMAETSAELENPYTLATLFHAASSNITAPPVDIESIINSIPSQDNPQSPPPPNAE
ncbi:MAG: hypothetical protein IKW46_08940 [Bacteroidaceae bacterium]|nr:hypothetical protein [Bacteroidaceae bacterium]